MSTEWEERVTEQTKIFRAMLHGLNVLHDHPEADVDIVVVPGLGANPETCWEYRGSGRKEDAEGSGSEDPLPATASGKKFNWIKDKNGLANLFPRTRILLYGYASAWRGKRKVLATMKSICDILLNDLKDKRKDVVITRPIIFIAHSMGGIVVAKALCRAKQTQAFESLITCTMGCVFFGTPFKGSNMARLALQYSSMFGNEAYESLLAFMKAEKNDVLDEVTQDFMQLRSSLSPPIDLYCFYEKVPTSWDYSERITKGLPTLIKHKYFATAARRLLEVGVLGQTCFVEKESAVLDGSSAVCMSTGHSDLVKFAAIDSDRFTPVRDALSKLIQNAKSNARRRVTALGQNILSQKYVNQVRESLEGVDMRSKTRTKLIKGRVTSWLMEERLYQHWLGGGNSNGSGLSCHPCLWLAGAPGLGKTNACLAAIQQVGEKNARDKLEMLPGQSEPFAAYFLCESSVGCNTAEELLKSIICQLINQDESLAQYGKSFVSGPRYRDLSSLNTGSHYPRTTAASPTVDNLWKTLLEILDDPVLDTIHVILGNIHCLEHDDSTIAFLDKLGEYARYIDSLPAEKRRVKWLLTSRHEKRIVERLRAPFISMIDLENDLEYGAKVKGARREHAREAVQRLRRSKNYSLDLSYSIRKSIEERSEDEIWTDVLCTLLGAQSLDSSYHTVRAWVDEFARLDIDQMIDRAWGTIISISEAARPELEELMRAMTIAYDDLTLPDLAVLTKINDLDRLKQLIRMCFPIIKIGESSGHRDRVVFALGEFKRRLASIYSTTESRNHLHGVMAMRCFSHIKEPQTFNDSQGAFSLDVTASLARSASTTTARLIEDTNVLELSTVDDDPDGTETGRDQVSYQQCLYPTHYLFKHLSEGFAEELYDDDAEFFAGKESALRRRWLNDYQQLTSDLKGIDAGMSSIHIAAAIGASELISVLVARMGQAALEWQGDSGRTALHVAALNNHLSAVHTLIEAGADIEAGEGFIGTALHQAAVNGNSGIMERLVSRGANINAFSTADGPVINAAIRSGNVDAVKLILRGDVRFDLDYTRCEPPLSLSASLSEPELFKEILESGKEKWLQNSNLVDRALDEAASSGRIESVKALLDFDHLYLNHILERAATSAALEKRWKTVDLLLDHIAKDTDQGNRRDVQLADPFYLAATGREERPDLLNKIWHLASQKIPREVRDFALYQATVMKKNLTVAWLLDKCNIDVNAPAVQPESLNEEYINNVSSMNYGNALNAAAATGNATVVAALLDRGADVRDSYALQLAAMEGHTEVMLILLERGALMDRKVADSAELSFAHGTALQAAIDREQTAAVLTLLKRGADPNCGGGEFASPILSATSRPDHTILGLLLEQPDIEVNVFGGPGMATPLTNAARYMSVEALRLLIRHEADINQADSSGNTALIMAALKGDEDSVTFLCESGADVTHRSPEHGLAIQAASTAGNTRCAHILGEQMGGRFDDYREQVKIDPSKAALERALKTLKEREQSIRKLKGVLAETKEHLEVAQKDMASTQAEKQRIEQLMSLQAEAYAANTEAVTVMENQHQHLRRSLRALEGRARLGEDSTVRMKAELEEEKQVSAGLRKRQGWTELQKERDEARQELDATREEARRQLQAEHQQRLQLQDESQSLHKHIAQIKEELQQAQAAIRAAEDQVAQERRLREELREEKDGAIQSLQKSNDDSQEIIAMMTRKGYSSPTSPNPGPTTPSPSALGNGADMGDHAPRVVSASHPHGPSQPGTSSRSSSYGATVASPPATNGGFRTVHGVHRKDGSLGGYRRYA